MLKNVLRSLAEKFGLKITRIRKAEKFVGLALDRSQPNRQKENSEGVALRSWPPPATFDNVALVLEYFSNRSDLPTFVQIGANDGQTSDSVNQFVKRAKMRAVLVEPIPATFRKLEEFYNGCENVQLIEAAIGHQTGIMTLHSVAQSGRWAGSNWASQLASFDREHLLSHGIREDEIEQVKVQCLNFQTLMERVKIEKIDVLQIDVEGFDMEIVKMALQLEVLPSCICFEFVQFAKKSDQYEVDEFYQLLAENGYSWSHDRINTMALHKSFINSGVPEQA